MNILKIHYFFKRIFSNILRKLFFASVLNNWTNEQTNHIHGDVFIILRMYHLHIFFKHFELTHWSLNTTDLNIVLYKYALQWSLLFIINIIYLWKYVLFVEMTVYKLHRKLSFLHRLSYWQDFSLSDLKEAKDNHSAVRHGNLIPTNQSRDETSC